MTNELDPQPEPPKRKPGRPPGFKGQSNRNIEYVCSSCGGTSTREKLVAKRVLYATIGDKPKTVRSRTVGWLCEVCMMRDPDWNLEAFMSSPGNADLRRKGDDAAAEQQG